MMALVFQFSHTMQHHWDEPVLHLDTDKQNNSPDAIHTGGYDVSYHVRGQGTIFDHLMISGRGNINKLADIQTDKKAVCISFLMYTSHLTQNNLY